MGCTCKTSFQRLRLRILELLSQQELLQVVVLLSKLLTGSQNQESGTRISYSVPTRPATVRARPSLSSSLPSQSKPSPSSMMDSREDTSSVPPARKVRMAEKPSATSPRLPQLKEETANTPNTNS